MKRFINRTMLFASLYRVPWLFPNAVRTAKCDFLKNVKRFCCRFYHSLVITQVLFSSLTGCSSLWSPLWPCFLSSVLNCSRSYCYPWHSKNCSSASPLKTYPESHCLMFSSVSPLRFPLNSFKMSNLILRSTFSECLEPANQKTDDLKPFHSL